MLKSTRDSKLTETNVQKLKHEARAKHSHQFLALRVCHGSPGIRFELASCLRLVIRIFSRDCQRTKSIEPKELLVDVFFLLLPIRPIFKLCLRRFHRHLQHLSYTPFRWHSFVPLRLTPSLKQVMCFCCAFSACLECLVGIHCDPNVAS